MQKSRMKSGKRKKNSYASFKINSEIPFLNSAILYTEYTFFLVFKNTTHITVTYQRMHYPANEPLCVHMKQKLTQTFESLFWWKYEEKKLNKYRTHVEAKNPDMYNLIFHIRFFLRQHFCVRQYFPSSRFNFFAQPLMSNSK